MNDEFVLNKDLLQCLPLPLAQLYRRAHNAKTPFDRCLASYYLWEATLKLLASIAVTLYVERNEHKDPLNETLRNLARPSLGHWWEILRRLVPVLADGGDPSFLSIRNLILGRTRDDLPRVAGLDAALQEELDGQRKSRSTVRVSELFDRLVRWRNREVGHGATGLRPSAFYDKLGRALLVGVSELLAQLDLVAGRKLIFVADVRRQRNEGWLVERFELIGEVAQRIPSLDLPESSAHDLPNPQCLFLQRSVLAAAGGETVTLTALHPLITYDFEAGEVQFLNSRRGRQRTEYLCYTSGRVSDRTDLLHERRTLLARALMTTVDEATESQWATTSAAEELVAIPSEPSSLARQLGEFELLSELGRGGMGVVYRAWQPSLGRQVALKKLSNAEDAKAEARFAREIRALGRVEHPNLVKIFTSGSTGEHWFYAMELVEGSTLAAVCERLQGASTAPATLDWPSWQFALSTVCEESRRREKPLGGGEMAEESRSAPSVRIPGIERGVQAPGRTYLRHMAELMRQVAEAADALHTAGVIHRDIKPGNIMVSADGNEAVLMDLGLAQLADESQGKLTRTRQFVGTLRYASPEQVLAVGGLDRRTDVYSLGATLWELLTLRPMFDATDKTPTPELMQRIQFEEATPPRKYHPGLPRDLGAIVSKCLEKDRRRRYSTAAELSEDLRRFLDGEPVKARQVNEAERFWRWCRRNPSRVALALVSMVFLLACAGLLIGSFFVAEQTRSAALLRYEKDQTDAALKDAKKQRVLAEKLSTQISFMKGSDLSLDGDGGRGVLWMARSLSTCPESATELQHSIRSALPSAASSLHTLVSIFDRPNQSLVAAFSPDGKSILFGGKDACLVDAMTGQLRGVPQVSANEVSGTAFSPDGKTFVTSTLSGLIRFAETATGRDNGPSINHPGIVKSISFHPDGKRFLVGSQSGVSLRCYDAASRQAVGPSFGCQDSLYMAAYSPNGKLIATAAKQNNASLWDAATGKRIGKPLIHPGVVFTVAFSADNKTLVTGCLDGGVRFWDVESGKAIGPVLRHKGAVRSAAFSHDGRFVLSGSEDGTARLWDAKSGHHVGQLLSHPAQLRIAMFSPDESHILTTGFEGTARLWRMTAQPSGTLILPHPGAVAAIAFSPDGRLALTGCQDSEQRPGESRLWDVATGKPAGPPLPQQGQVMVVAFSPDGRLALTGGNEGTVRVWNTIDSSAAQLPWKYGNIVGAIAFSPDGKFAAIGGRNSEVQVRRVATGEVVSKRVVDVQGWWVWSLAFTPDGQRLLTGGGLASQLWNPLSMEAIGEPMRHKAEVRTVILSPDGEVVLTCGYDKIARLWSAHDGHPLSPELEHKGEILSGAFRADGKVVATASADGTVRLWEVPTGHPLMAPLFHDGWVRSLSFSPDCKTLVTGCDDGIVRLWSAEEGGLPGAVLQHHGPVNRVAYSPDGKAILTASSDGTAQLWRPPIPIRGDPARAEVWAEVITGMALNADGTVQVLPATQWLRQLHRLHELGDSP